MKEFSTAGYVLKYQSRDIGMKSIVSKTVMWYGNKIYHTDTKNKNHIAFNVNFNSLGTDYFKLY